jgi:hypothetical protein
MQDGVRSEIGDADGVLKPPAQVRGLTTNKKRANRTNPLAGKGAK